MEDRYRLPCPHRWQSIRVGERVFCSNCQDTFPLKGSAELLWRSASAELHHHANLIDSLKEILRMLIPLKDSHRCGSPHTEEEDRFLARMRNNGGDVDLVCVRCLPEFIAEPVMGFSDIYRRDDPVVKKYYPPWDYQCRCHSIPLTLADAARKGIAEAQEWLRTGLPPIEPAWVDDPGFESSPDWGTS